jgi:hypothetical protein
MSRKFDVSDVNRRQFLAVAGGAAAASSLSAGKGINFANAAATPLINYPVTIDARTTPFTYSTTVPVAGTQAYHLHLASANSTVTFTAITSGANQHSAAIFFPTDTPFVDKNGRPMYAFAWSQTEEPLAVLLMDPDASGPFEYRVVVFDKLTGTTLSEDPKIIVGSGNYELNEIIEKLERIRKAHPDEDKTIESIKTELQQLFLGLK